jgi:hypothetical protein
MEFLKAACARGVSLPDVLLLLLLLTNEPHVPSLMASY